MRSYPLTFTSVVINPARLVRITRLDGEQLFIAESDGPITVGIDEVYTPLPGANISAVKHIINGEMPSMEIAFAHSDGGTIDTSELNNGFWDGASVVVYLVDRAGDLLTTPLGDPLFTGVIDSVMLDPVSGAGTFDIRGLAAQAEAFIQRFQPMCRTDLFSVLCQVNPASFSHTGTVGTLLNRFNFTVAGLGAPPADGWFNQGTFETASGFKGVIANWVQSSLKLTTYQPNCLSRLVPGEAVTLYAGCDKTGTTCRTKFSNAINFQGEDHFLGQNSIVGT